MYYHSSTSKPGSSSLRFTVDCREKSWKGGLRDDINQALNHLLVVDTRCAIYELIPLLNDEAARTLNDIVKWRPTNNQNWLQELDVQIIVAGAASTEPAVSELVGRLATCIE